MGAKCSRVKLRGKTKKVVRKLDDHDGHDLNEVDFYEDIEPTYLNINDVLPQDRSDNNDDNAQAIDENHIQHRNPSALSRDSAFSETTVHCNAFSSSSINHLHSIDESDDDSTPYYLLGGEKLVSTQKNCEVKSLCYQKDCCRKDYCRKDVTSSEIQHMVEAFLPLIQDSIRVLEVVPYIDFIGDTRPLRNKERESPRAAVQMLVEMIKASEEPGRWQTFLEALSRGGYEYLHDLLKGRTEEDHTVQRKLLRLFTPRLINRIEPQEFIDHLYEKNVISETDMEEIRCEERSRGAIAASLMLLEYIPRKHHDWYDIFVDVLNKCGLEDMVDDFQISQSFSTSMQTETQLVPCCTENNEYLGDHETTMKDPFYLKGTEDLKSYLTPVFDKCNKDNSNKKDTTNGYPTLADDKYFSDNVSHKPEPLGETFSDNINNEKLRKQRDHLRSLLDEKRMKKIFEKEIRDLQTELLLLENDDFVSHALESKKTKSNTSDDTDLKPKHKSTQTSSQSVHTNDTQAIDHRLNGIETHIVSLTEEVQEIKSSHILPKAELHQLHSLLKSHMDKTNSNANDLNVAPVPHFKHTISLADSGFGLDYRSGSTSDVYYISDVY